MNTADSRFFQQHFPRTEFATRRDILFDAIGPDAHVVLCGRCEPIGPRFVQSKTFFYLSGIEIPNAQLMMSGPERKTTLYLPHRDPEKHPEETGLGVEDADAIIAASSVEAVVETAQLEKDLQAVKTLYVQDAEDELPCRTRFEAAAIASRQVANPWDGRPTARGRFVALSQERGPRKRKIRGPTPTISEMRRVKSPCEIGVLRRAGYLSALATTEAMRLTKVGLVERQLSALASYIYLTHGAVGEAYPQIIASGNNMQFGHYHRGDASLKDGEIVLVDTAPDYGNYGSDIGRIWPVNGTYAPWQRELYSYITTYHKTLLGLLKPGATKDGVQQEAAAIMAGVLAKTTFSKEIYRQAAERVLQSNPLSHPVGLSVHDGSPYKHKPLEPGVVLSVDPMMTVREEELYIRCEDTVVITDDGIETLTGAAPLDCDEIEATMRMPSGFPLYETATAWDPGR